MFADKNLKDKNPVRTAASLVGFGKKGGDKIKY